MPSNVLNRTCNLRRVISSCIVQQVLVMWSREHLTFYRSYFKQLYAELYI